MSIARLAGVRFDVEKLRRLEDILGKYASNRGWDYMEIGDEEQR